MVEVVEEESFFLTASVIRIIDWSILSSVVIELLVENIEILCRWMNRVNRGKSIEKNQSSFLQAILRVRVKVYWETACGSFGYVSQVAVLFELLFITDNFRKLFPFLFAITGHEFSKSN